MKIQILADLRAKLQAARRQRQTRAALRELCGHWRLRMQSSQGDGSTWQRGLTGLTIRLQGEQVSIRYHAGDEVARQQRLHLDGRAYFALLEMPDGSLAVGQQRSTFQDDMAVEERCGVDRLPQDLTFERDSRFTVNRRGQLVVFTREQDENGERVLQHVFDNAQRRLPSFEEAECCEPPRPVRPATLTPALVALSSIAP